MTSRLTRWILVAALFAGCESTDCAPGALDCECYPNGTCNAGLTCSTDRCVPEDGGGRDGGPRVSPTDGGGSGDDGGEPIPTGPLSLDVAYVESLANRDCIEARLERTTPVLPEGETYLSDAGPAGLPSALSIVTPECTVEGSVLRCPSDVRELTLRLTGPAALRFDARGGTDITVTCDGCGRLIEPTRWLIRPVASASPPPRTVTFAMAAVETAVGPRDIRIARSGPLATSPPLELRNLRVGALQFSEPPPTIGSNERIVIPLGQDAAGLHAFRVDRTGSYFVGPSPVRGSVSSGCRLYDMSLRPVSAPLTPVYEAGHEPPSGPCNPATGCVSPYGQSVTLDPGDYFMQCDGPSTSDRRDRIAMSVRSYDESFIGACHVLHWFFRARRGDTPLTDLDRDQLAVTVDGRDLGVEAGAVLNRSPAVVRLLIDRSYSITEAGARDAVAEAVGSLAEAMPEGALFTVEVFASEMFVPQTLELGQSYWSWSPQIVRESMAAYEPWAAPTSASFTKLYDAIAMSAYEASAGEGQEGWMLPAGFSLEQMIVAFTDATDTASTQIVDASGAPSDERLRDHLDACGVSVNAIGLGDDVQVDVLRGISDGAFFGAGTPAELEGAFVRAAADLNSRYRLRIITPEPVEVTTESTLTVTHNGESVTGVYTPPEEPCVSPYDG